MSRSPSAIFTLVTSAHETQEADDNLRFLLSKYGMLLPPSDWAHAVAEHLVRSSAVPRAQSLTLTCRRPSPLATLDV